MKDKYEESIKKRIDFNKVRIGELITENIELEKTLLAKKNNAYGMDAFKLLTNEKYRIEMAIGISKTKKEACKMLIMDERTFYRRIAKYGIQKKR